MWLLILSFFLVTFLVGWLFFGYFILVWCLGLFRSKTDPRIPSALPTVSLIIPCFNEADEIIAKLDNIKSLDYPKDLLEVYFVDGSSMDNTVELLSSAIRDDEPYKILQCPHRGKIDQLNYALPRLKSELIINSDADGRLSNDAVKWIAAEFSMDDEVDVVGAYCKPIDAIKIEEYYWSAHNKARFLESDLKSSSIVISQCYAFRRGFIDTFPKDVIADDVYIAFLAHVRRRRVVYSRHAIAVETRGPKSYSDFMIHKFRKSNAFLRESLRFLYLLPEMDPFCKMMFITRTFQQLVLPSALLLWFLAAGALLTTFRCDIVAFGLIFLMLLCMLTSTIFSKFKLPEGKTHYSFSTTVKGYLLTLFTMLFTGITYPFIKQGSIYARLKNNENE